MSERAGGFEALVAFAIRVLSAAFVFGLQVLLARLMALEAYGGFVTLWTWLIALGSFAALGFAEASVRFLPRYQSRGREDRIARFWRFGLKTIAVGALAMAGLAIVAALILGADAPPGLVVLFVGLGLPFLAIEYYLEGVARSFGWYRLTTVPVYLVRPVLIGAGAIGLHAAGIELTLPVVGALVVAAMAAVALGILVVLSLRLAPYGRGRADRRSRRLWAFAAMPLLLASGFEDLVSYADVLVLSLLLPPQEVAVYFAAARALALANFVYFAIYLVSGRRFALDIAAREPAALQASILEATRMTLWLTVIAAAATVIAGPMLLGAFGGDFVAGYPVMLVLALGLVAKALAGQAGEWLVVSGRQKAAIALNALTLASILALTVLLVPAFGPLGAAMASALSWLLRSLAIARVAHRSAGIRVISLRLPNLRGA